MNPYITLRILAENPLNNKQDVYWSYSDIIEGGWAEEKEVLKNLDKGAEITPATSLSKITRISFLMRILVSPLQKLKRFPTPANG
jgi:hypothetical protein